MLSQQSAIERKEEAEAEKRRIKEEGEVGSPDHHAEKSSSSQDPTDSSNSSPGRKRRMSHVPYRDSKLTSLVQDSLGKHASTLFICTLSPSAACLAESISTMQFADRAMRVQIEPSRHAGSVHAAVGGKGGHEKNSVVLEAMQEEHKKEVKRLRLLIKYLRNGMEGRNHQVDAYLDGLAVSDLDSASREKGLAMELLKSQNGQVHLEEQLAAVKEQLKHEQDEKKAICQLVYGQDCPHYEHVIERPANDEEAAAGEEAAEKRFFEEHGFHAHKEHTHRKAVVSGVPEKKAVNKRRHTTALHTSAQSHEPCASTPTPAIIEGEIEEAKVLESMVREIEKKEGEGEQPQAEVEAGNDEEEKEPKAEGGRVVLSHKKKVDFELQSSLLRLEREELDRRLALLKEWSHNEDQRWSFLSRCMRQVQDDLKESKEASEKLSDGDKDLQVAVVGLRERVSLMEMSFAVHERSMEILKASMSKAPEVLLPPSPPKRSAEELGKNSRRRSSAM